MDYSLLKKKYLKYKTKYLLINGGSIYIKNHNSELNVQYEKKRFDEEYEQYLNIKKIEYIKESCKISEPEFNTDYYYNGHDFHNLSINYNLTEIKENYEKYGYIQLRKYNNEKILIIGCGNKRLDCGNIDVCSKEENIAYNKFHTHENIFTIDMALVANPSIVSEIKLDKTYPTLQNDSFDLIIFEGSEGVNALSNLDKEIERLLNTNTLSFCIASKPIGRSFIECIYSIKRLGKYYVLNNESYNISHEQQYTLLPLSRNSSNITSEISSIDY